MRQKFKQWMCYAVIIVLLPYIVTVFINGPSIVASTNVDETYVKVKMKAGESQMPIQEYCIGLLAREIPAQYEKETLKAQAVLVRTDVYKKIKETGSQTVLEGEFWTAEQMKEAWGIKKYNKYYAALEKAWQETEGQVLLFGENLAATPFFRLSNGGTRDGKEALGTEDYPYLKIVDCPLDIEATEQIQTVTLEDMDAEITACDTAGYVQSVRIGQENISGEEFRNTYGLASSCFTLQKYNGKLRITTRGVGHGVGLSQYTANKMAKQEKTYEDILKYFFDGTELKEVAEILIDTE